MSAGLLPSTQLEAHHCPLGNPDRLLLGETRSSVAEMAAFIAQHMSYTGRFVELSGEDYPPALGRTPWSVPRPFVLDMQAAVGLGYAPATTYADAVKLTCDWLVETASDG